MMNPELWEELDPNKEVDFAVLTITPKSLKFNKDTLNALTSPDFVKVMLNEKGKQLAIQACQAEDRNAIDATPQEGKRVRGIVMKSPYFLSRVARILPLSKDGQPVNYRVAGMYYPDESSVIFNLDEAQEQAVKPRKPRKSVEEKEKVEGDGLF